MGCSYFIFQVSCEASLTLALFQIFYETYCFETFPKHFMKSRLEMLPQKRFQENYLVFFYLWWHLLFWHIQMLERVQKRFHCVFISRTS